MKNKLACFIIVILSSISLLANEPAKSTENPNSKYDENSIFYAAENRNLIGNPGFEESTNNWTLAKYNGSAANFKTDSLNSSFADCHGIVHTSGSLDMQYEDIQLINFLEISQHTNYNISFKAIVEEECLISISLSNGIETYFEEKLLLRPGQTIYGPYSYKSDFEESFTFFSFNLGRTEATISLDDISITADNTEKEFENIIAKSGINFKTSSGGRELFISLPTSARFDYPIAVYNEMGKSIKTNKIREGSQEVFLKIHNTIDPGNYTLKIYGPDEVLNHKFSIK